MIIRIPYPGGGVAPYNPATDIPNLAGWWEADQIAPGEGASVATWPDHFTTGHDLAAITTAPTWRGGVLNGLPVIRFDGVADGLTAAWTQSAPATLWLVARYRTVSGTNPTLCDGATLNHMRVFAPDSSMLDTYASGFGPAASTTVTAWHVYTLVFDPASPYIQVDTAAATTSPAPGGPSPDGLTLGITGLSPHVEAGAVDIAAALMADGHAAPATLTGARDYLRSKYGL